MPNPYAITSSETRSECESTSVWRAFAFGLVGYLAPFAILFPMCWMAYGWLAASDNFDRIVAMHGTISFAGFAALAPNFACMVLFTVAGYRRFSSQGFGGRRLGPLPLGLATLFGYFVVLLTTVVWFPLPWRWPAELSNLVRSGLVAVFPLSVIAYRLISSRRTMS
jgi:hypothetical protein